MRYYTGYRNQFVQSVNSICAHVPKYIIYGWGIYCTRVFKILHREQVCTHIVSSYICNVWILNMMFFKTIIIVCLHWLAHDLCTSSYLNRRQAIICEHDVIWEKHANAIRSPQANTNTETLPFESPAEPNSVRCHNGPFSRTLWIGNTLIVSIVQFISKASIPHNGFYRKGNA